MAHCSSKTSVPAAVMPTELPQSTALTHDASADAGSRLQAMESEQLGLIPHEERMDNMGSTIQQEFKEAGLIIVDVTVGDGEQARPGMLVHSFVVSHFA